VILTPQYAARSEEYVVQQCTGDGPNYGVRLQRIPARGSEAEAEAEAPEPDYYEVLQLGPHADTEAIHRVYKMMAARFHPDNRETGDIEEFLLLKTAYEVLSDPVRRAEYDARRGTGQAAGPMPVFELKDFVTGVEAEANRRLGVMSLLYNQRRLDADHPSVSLLDLERRMGFPREYLNFTLWYLRAKNLVSAADNSDYVITAEGADFVEANIGKSEILGKLLFPEGSKSRSGSSPWAAANHSWDAGEAESGTRTLRAAR
jgi:curved DNA-binding protein CbpA